MYSGKLNENQYLLRFEKGEDLVTVLKTFLSEKQIKNGEISAIGSVQNPVLAHYSVETKKYSEKQLDGIFEVLSILGTIGLVENEPAPHMHVTLSDEEMNALGGHLVKATVSATLEMIIHVFPTEFSKKHNEEIGLNLFELPEQTS